MPPGSWSLSGVQCLIDCRLEFFGGKWLDQAGAEANAELCKLGWRFADARADHRQRRACDRRRLSKQRADRLDWLDDGHVGADQVFGVGYPDPDRLVTETGEHALQQTSDVPVGLADQDSCHAIRIGVAHWIAVGNRYGRRMSSPAFCDEPFPLDGVAICAKVDHHESRAGYLLEDQWPNRDQLVYAPLVAGSRVWLPPALPGNREVSRPSIIYMD
jgi:hypothetical protein